MRNLLLVLLLLVITVLASVLLATPAIAGTDGGVGGAKEVSSTLEFRTFTPDALGGEKPASRRATYCKWETEFENITGKPVNGLHIEFANDVETMEQYEPFTEAKASPINSKVWNFTGSLIEAGDIITLTGYGEKGSCKISKWWWTSYGVKVGVVHKLLLGQVLSVLTPMPTAGNVRKEVFQQGGFAPSFDSPVYGLLVGIPRKDKKKEFGWTVIRNADDMAKSLYEKGTLHTGAPRGLNRTNIGGKLVGELKSLSPSKHNNRLFAELVALKFNIAASALGVTPEGFAELVYDDGGSNVLNGLTIREIALRGDTLMTYIKGKTQAEYTNLEATVRKINRAFVGEIDTVSNIDGIRLTGIVSTAAVAFLHISPESEPVNYYYDNESFTGAGEAPASFTLNQNYPNPFNPATTISFTLADRSIVTLTVYNILGQEVASLIGGAILEGGEQEVLFEAAGLPSGSYLYRLVAEQIGEDDAAAGARLVETKSMLLVK